LLTARNSVSIVNIVYAAVVYSLNPSKSGLIVSKPTAVGSSTDDADGTDAKSASCFGESALHTQNLILRRIAMGERRHN